MQLNVSFFFEVISLICLQGSLRDGFDFSLWSPASSSADKLKSILPILSDLGKQIGVRVLLGGVGDLVPPQRAASHGCPVESQSF